MKRDFLGAASGRGSKAGEALQEERESSSPMFVSEMLTGILRAVGQEEKVDRFMKRVADEVLWNNAKVPWRRSPLWLVVRVSLRMLVGQEEYKNFMILFMARALDIAIRMEIPGDRLFIMNAKVARRVYKLRDRMPNFVIEEARVTVDRATTRIQGGWLNAQGKVKRVNWNTWAFSFTNDTSITMVNSREYVKALRGIKCKKPERGSFSPNELKRFDLETMAMPDISELNDTAGGGGERDKKEPWKKDTQKKNDVQERKDAEERKDARERKDIMLADFESWVMKNLDMWLLSNINLPTAFTDLGERIEDYMAVAKKTYQGDPEKNSIMVLTIMELWVALDKLTVKDCPLLRDYSPEFNESFLSALLLPQAQQRTRLSRIETYIQTRRSSALPTSVSVFKEITSASFPVRYFNSSRALNLLRDRITEAATNARIAKIAELMRLEEEYDGLQSTIRTRSCDYFTHWTQGWTRHDRKCKKCAMIKEANGMRIEVHEWPLPEDELMQAAVMFELRCPASFAIWRESTFRILTDICSPKPPPPNEQKPYNTVATYSGLKSYFDGSQLTRQSKVNYTSTTKSILSSHYREARLPATIDDICVKNALQFALHDANTRMWTADRLPKIDIRHLCTFILPDGPYRGLQDTLKGTAHLANQVLTRQHKCPPELQLNEYIAFGLLRSGRRLQWLNMLREIRSRILTFSAEAVSLLYLQAAWQVGPVGSKKDERECHIEPMEERFGREMIREMSTMLKDVEANWQEVVAAQTMIVLAVQILVGTRSEEVEGEAVQFLREARRVCLQWTRELAGKLPECKPGEVREFQLRVVQMAATCRMTYNVEDSHIWDMLYTDEDIAVLVECATMIHDNTPAIVGTLPRGVALLLERDTRLAYAIEFHLRDLVTTSARGIDLKPIWSAYEQGTRWVAMPGKNSRWMYTYTGESEDSKSQKVHYNLISGRLLVEGLPLGRMPVEYTSNATYEELFGEKVLDVFPSSVPGMIFQTKHPISGHKVAFALHENELMIRTRNEKNGLIHQLIPRSKLAGDFPTNILSNHVFWLQLPSVSEISSGFDHTNGRINLHEKDSPWTPKEDWYISQSYHSSLTKLRLGPQCLLLDVRSPMTTMITDILAPLESAEFIDVTYKYSVISVHLPRLKLDFSMNRSNKLVCKQFLGMTIDEDQRIGTFIGLENLLVVRQGPTRSVIVPRGNVHFEQRDSHTKVEIDTKGMNRVKYHIYTVNTTLGALVGNGSLTSHLYRIYLHAVTSHCQPDPLTGRTGTEEALAGLRAAATRSFQIVETDSIDANLFRLIAALTPVRTYYPPHLKRMQQVKWQPGLSAIAQHDQFYKEVKEVSEYAGMLNIFEDVKGSILLRNAGDESLAERAAIRNAVFRTEQFGGSMAEKKSEDRIYEARDMVNGSVLEARVAYIAELVERWQGKLSVHPNILGVLEELGEIRGRVSAVEIAKLQVGYDQKWLNPNLAEDWVALYDALRGSTDDELYDWMFLLSTLTYSKKIDLRIIETLLAFGTEVVFKDIDPPDYPSYNLHHGYKPSSEALSNIIKGFVKDFCDSQESQMEDSPLETEQEAHERRFEMFNRNKKIQGKKIIRELLFNWPCTDLDIADLDDYPLYKVPEVLLAVKPLFESWSRNSEFRDHIAEVQKVLDRINTHRPPALQFYRFEPCKYTTSSQKNTIRFSDLLARTPPVLPAHPDFLDRPDFLGRNPVVQRSGADSVPKDDSLETLVQDFRGARPSKFRKIYTGGLEKSITAFRDQVVPPDTVEGAGLIDKLKSLRNESEKYMWAIFNAINARIVPLRLKGSTMVSKAGLWPRISPMLLLQQLASNSAVHLSPEWKAALVTYGTAITMVQRLQRLLNILYLAPRHELSPEISSDFLKEFRNIGHQNWDPIKEPDWLLIEIENNLLIRPVQADIASSMIMPEGGQNSIMQLCMGEGKTSVIVPIVAASLADGKKLVRVVVLKPLSGQMFQTLVQKLGGLVNRRIFFMPFSRGITMGEKEVKVVKRLYDDCMKNCGILLVQPEHILSFKLLGLEWLYTSQNKRQNGDAEASNGKSDGEVARLLLNTQRWLEKYSRDILDESDEVIAVKHELIYTIGNPAPIENHPDRWVIIQEIFDLIQEHFKGLKPNVQDFEVEKHEQARRFGSVRILNLEAGRKMLHEIAGKIIEGNADTFQYGDRTDFSLSHFRLFPTEKRELAARFIVETDMTETEALPLLTYFKENTISSGILYLLRGLIAHNILLFSLKEKRWKVDYGLDLKRSLLAVPYRAKDSPSGKAEFSHPDVAITLTCLSYYYGGLNETQLETSFRNLLKSDNPTLEYERWIKGVDLPKPYMKRLNGINLEDRKQWKELIYPTFNFNKAVIDSYLSRVVFPKEAKEFPHKLSTSGWDIAEEKTHPTTGFSGTNDNRFLLPLSIKQLDSTEQLNTNARVLSYLLQKENSYKCTAGPNNERIGVEQLLEMLAKHPDGRPVQVLLDVGAQVLELKNDEVAKRWLELVGEHTAQAAVYFNDNDELTVLTRDGNTEPLMVSAFADGLGSCLVYLDEAHTRGTDLKLPIKSRAAVTLGPNLTKDRLVQACMRMRKLGGGHSVLFCGPPEIDRQILRIAHADKRRVIMVRDVLFWCMQETCNNARKLLPIWAKQGIGYQKHLDAWKDIGELQRFPKALLEKESKTLKEHYGFERSRDEKIDSYRKPEITNSQVDKILKKCRDFKVESFHSARMLEEQERELAHEVECERENERPSEVEPIKHHLSDEVKEFITTGELQTHYRTIIPAFSVLSRTSAKEHLQQTAFSRGLLATSDFCEVIERGQRKDDMTDDFLRPVNWIVSSTIDRNILVIMSSFEVNRLLPEIRTSPHVILHMYSPQVTHSTPSYELLDFYPIPRLPYPWQPNFSLTDQLNIFAGQLYFRDFEAYERVCGFLGLYLNETLSERRAAIHSDGFVNKLDRQGLEMKYESPFVKSPVTLLRMLIAFRRKGQSYITTHMGHILHGRLLTKEDIEVRVEEEVC